MKGQVLGSWAQLFDDEDEDDGVPLSGVEAGEGDERGEGFLGGGGVKVFLLFSFSFSFF